MPSRRLDVHRLAAHHPSNPRLGVALVVLSVLLSMAGGPAAHAAQATPTDSPGDHDHGHMAENGTPTAAEQAAADRLVAATRSEAARYSDSATAEKDGYRPVTPFAFYGARAAHYQRDVAILDGRLLDPRRPEHLIYLKSPDSRLTLIGVMYLAPPGQGPPIGGPLTFWHTHDDLCANRLGVVPMLPTGTCLAGTSPLQLEMLHVWLVDHPEGPFAEAPPPSTVTVTTPWDDTGGSLAAAASLLDWRVLLEKIGALLFLSPSEVADRMETGESWAEMAVEQGVPRSDLEEVVSAQFALDYERAVANGDMTPAQRDLLVRVLPGIIGRIVALHRGEPWMVTAEATPTALTRRESFDEDVTR
jgi:hypothetical protein